MKTPPLGIALPRDADLLQTYDATRLLHEAALAADPDDQARIRDFLAGLPENGTSKSVNGE